jgi:hypothetical protein
MERRVLELTDQLAAASAAASEKPTTAVDAGEEDEAMLSTQVQPAAVVTEGAAASHHPQQQQPSAQTVGAVGVGAHPGLAPGRASESEERLGGQVAALKLRLEQAAAAREAAEGVLRAEVRDARGQVGCGVWAGWVRVWVPPECALRAAGHVLIGLIGRLALHPVVCVRVLGGTLEQHHCTLAAHADNAYNAVMHASALWGKVL